VTATAGVLLVTSAAPLGSRELSAGESAQLAALPGEPRKRTWLTARRALRHGLAAAGLPGDTSAYRFPHRVASLSHSAELAVAAVLVADPGAAVGVGVDVELDRTPDVRTAQFFLTEAEQAWLDTVPGDVRPAALVRLWTVKEALFKADPGNAGTVLRDYGLGDPAAYRGAAARTGGPMSAGPEFRYVSFALPRGAVSVAVALSHS
jgi:4'-phosphopantetheinyl transferase EntD